jgi:hypothetical protein
MLLCRQLRGPGALRGYVLIRSQGGHHCDLVAVDQCLTDGAVGTLQRRDATPRRARVTACRRFAKTANRPTA